MLLCKNNLFLEAVLQCSLFSYPCSQTNSRLSLSPSQHAGHVTITEDTVSMVDLRWFFFCCCCRCCFFFHPLFHHIDKTVLLNCRHFNEGNTQFNFEDGTEKMPAMSLPFMWIWIVLKGNTRVNLLVLCSTRNSAYYRTFQANNYYLLNGPVNLWLFNLSVFCFFFGTRFSSLLFNPCFCI